VYSPSVSTHMSQSVVYDPQSRPEHVRSLLVSLNSSCQVTAEWQEKVTMHHEGTISNLLA